MRTYRRIRPERPRRRRHCTAEPAPAEPYRLPSRTPPDLTVFRSFVCPKCDRAGSLTTAPCCRPGRMSVICLACRYTTTVKIR